LSRKIIILGGIGSGMVVAEAVKALAAAGERIELLGFLNDHERKGSQLGDIPVLGRFEQWCECPGDTQFISAIPSVREAWHRYRRILSLGIPQERWSTIVHPAAQVSSGARIGVGSYIGPGAMVQCGVVAGNHLGLRGYVSHDAQLGDYVQVGPNATVLGYSRLGEGVYFSANAVCRDRITIGRYAVIGIGSTVVGDVADCEVVAGNPARVIDRVQVPMELAGSGC
jgi:sugar O-acyltransferase (sialic acid O-acetyltransferase NeuD family)